MADHNYDGGLNRRQLRLDLTGTELPSSLEELKAVAEDLQREKSELLCQLKAEDKDRHSYYTQLEHLARQMRELPLPTDSPSLEYELERRRLELEAQRQQELMMKTLGPTSEVVRRREERILTLRGLDQKLSQINNLIAEQNGERETGKSYTCQTGEGSQGEWTLDKDLWLSGTSLHLHLDDKPGHFDTASVISFTSSIHSNCITGSGSSGTAAPERSRTHLGPKVEVVYNLLTMLFSHDRHNVSQKLLHMSVNPETRSTLHQVGCIPLLVQLIYNQDSGEAVNDSSHNWMLSDGDKVTRNSAAQALHNLVYNNPDDRKAKKEMRILRLLELIREYCDNLREGLSRRLAQKPIEDPFPCPEIDDMMRHPCTVVTNLMKLSFDDDHRQAMSHLGTLQALAELLHLDHLAHGTFCNEAQCTTLRRYASMTLTNLTFGHGPNKALLCSIRPLLAILAQQLASPNDDLRQVTASVVRNLSWRADSASKEALRQADVVRSLIKVAMVTDRESTLKSMLSALWNLSAHSSQNKADICSTPGALEFLVKTLNYKSESKTLSVVESGGGILRNISSHIATREDYRTTLRKNNCLQILLQQLRSPSLTVVSNACGALWNLSARCREDQVALCNLGAVSMLRSLIHSRHKMIAMGSSAALKNLEMAGLGSMLNSRASSASTPLQARKQKALQQEIDQTLSELCDNIEPSSPIETIAGRGPFDRRMYRSLGGHNTSPYGRSVTPVVPRNNTAPQRQMRSSSLERESNKSFVPIEKVPSEQQATASHSTDSSTVTNLKMSHTNWRPHQNEISYTTMNYEDEDQPVNYSLKYTEEVPTALPTARWSSSGPSTSEASDALDSSSTVPTTSTAAAEKLDSSTVKKVMVYSAYRETDLDQPEQPTDFSLRYAEDEDYPASNDTLKTYYIEGTPYETPFSCSSAVSLTDIRDIGIDDVKSEGTAASKKEYDRFSEEKSLCNVDPAIAETEQEKQEMAGGKATKTPPITRRPAQKEGKTVTFSTDDNYAEQTPLMFSRCSSMESLASIDQQQINDDGSIVSEFSRLTSRAVSPSELPDSPGQTMPPSPRRHQAPEQIPSTISVSVTKPKDVFEDATNNFGQEGTPGYTRAASPLSQLSFDDEPSLPSSRPMLAPPPPPPPPPPPLPSRVSETEGAVSSGAVKDFHKEPNVVHPNVARITKASCEQFQGVFFDQTRTFHEEESPSLTRCTSLSSLHIDGEVIGTAKFIAPIQEKPALPLPIKQDEEKVLEQSSSVGSVDSVKEAPILSVSTEHHQSTEWSEGSDSEDDDLLENCISKGMPLSRIPTVPNTQQQPLASQKITTSSVLPKKPSSIPKSASAHSIGRNSNIPLPNGSRLSIPSSASANSGLTAFQASRQGINGKKIDVDESGSDCSVDDDEILFQCIKSAMPKAKPLSSKLSHSNAIKQVTHNPSGMQRSRQLKAPMDLPVLQLKEQRVPPLHGPYGNVPKIPIRAKSSDGLRSSGRRSRHSSQGSCRLGASGSSNNTSVDTDSRYCYRVEDTPVTFSRNSSLSSLSVSSNDDEPSADDQALLDSCINSAMPKPKTALSKQSENADLSKACSSKSKPSVGKIPTSQSWTGLRRAGDGQASVTVTGIRISASANPIVASNSTNISNVLTLSDSADTNGSVAPKLPSTINNSVETESSVTRASPEHVDSDNIIVSSLPSVMTQSTLIRMEAIEIATQISLSLESSQSMSNGLDHVPSLSSSFINGAEGLLENGQSKSSSVGKKFDCRHSSGKGRITNGNLLLKQALSSNMQTSTESLSLSSSCHSNIDNIKPPSSMVSTNELSSSRIDSSSLKCSVLDESYFDDEQRREGLLQELAILEQSVDENANTDTPATSNEEATSKKRLTPRARRQADKERYQTYTLNANEMDADGTLEEVFDSNGETGMAEESVNEAIKENVSSGMKTPKQRRSEERERFKTQTLSTADIPSDFVEKAEIESDEKIVTSPSDIPISSDELCALEQDANVVIRTLKEQNKLSRKNSGSSEFVSEECLLDCETLSLVSNESESERSLSLRMRKLSLQTTNSGINSAKLPSNNPEDTDVSPRSRIVKPEEKNEDQGILKSIRGRRRVLCPVRVAPSNGSSRPGAFKNPSGTSQSKNTTLVNNATRTAQRRGRSASPASPSPVRPNRTSSLRQTTTQKAKYPSAPVLENSTANPMHMRLRPSSKSPRISSAPCSPRQLDESQQQYKRRSLEVNCKTTPNKLEETCIRAATTVKSAEEAVEFDPLHPPLAATGKQGTFTKEKSSTSDVTQLAESPEEKKSKVPPKVPPKPKLKQESKIGELGPKPAVPKKPSRLNGASPLSSPRSKGSPALGRRSISSASIGSDSTGTTTGGEEFSSQQQKRTPPKKVVTSKIASLWKQVEESRSKQKLEQSDARKWISRGEIAKPVTEDKAVGTNSTSPGNSNSNSGSHGSSLEGSLLQPRTMVSSSTFEKLSSFSGSQLPIVYTNDKVSPPSKLPFRLPRFGRSSSTNSPNSDTADAEDKRQVRVTAL